MAVFETPSQSPAQRVRAAHPGSGRVASAPGTWVLIGENVDHFGGVTLAGTRALLDDEKEQLRSLVTGFDHETISQLATFEAVKDSGKTKK